MPCRIDLDSFIVLGNNETPITITGADTQSKRGYVLFDKEWHQGTVCQLNERNEHCVITSADKKSREGNDIMICHSE